MSEQASQPTTTRRNRNKNLKILQYNVQKSYTTMQELLRDKRAWKFDIIAIQEPHRQHYKDLPTTTNPQAGRFYLYYPPYTNTRVCLFINKRIPISHIRARNYGPDITSVTILAQDPDQKDVTVVNVYNETDTLSPVNGTLSASSLPQLEQVLRQDPAATRHKHSSRRLQHTSPKVGRTRRRKQSQ
jgi:endonuclease/exonuclease/phosphatase (EEP) superfamily protein YafD